MAQVIASYGLLLGVGLAGDYGPWRWSTELPSQIGNIQAGPSGRAPDAVDRLFKGRPTLGQVLEALGRPDGFSRQGTHSLSQGTVTNMAEGGTLRFLLDGRGELHVQTGDFVRIDQAIRWMNDGKGELLAK